MDEEMIKQERNTLDHYLRQVLLSISLLPPSREMSIVKTKVEEAALWHGAARAGGFSKASGT